MNEVIIITGARGTGKSTLAATYLPPSEVARAFVHDSEDSMNNVRVQLNQAGLDFGYYGNLKARFSNLPSDNDLLSRITQGKLPWVDPKVRSSLAVYYQYVLNDLDANLMQGQYKVYIHDTLEKLESGMAAWVEENKKASGVTITAYGRLWTDGVYPLYENLLAAVFARGVETVILTSHLKTPWENNHPIVGKVEPAGKKLLYRLSSLMMWLVNDGRNADGAPAALVLKERLGKVAPDSADGWTIRQMLPRRIPHCTWRDIKRYLVDGCNLAKPADGETLSDAETRMISELLSDEQMRLMILDAEKEIETIRAQSPILGFTEEGAPVAEPRIEPAPQVADAQARATELLAVGKTPQEVAVEVGIPLPVVLRLKQQIVGG